MPRIVFLGTGAAAPSRDDVRHDSATWVSYGSDCNILIDCGEGAKYNLLRAGLTRKLHHLLLTHDHYDHLMGITGLVAMLSLTKASPVPLTVFGPSPAIQRAKILTGLIRSQANAEIGIDVNFTELHPQDESYLGLVHVKAFATHHREKESLGYVLTSTARPDERICLTGDTVYFPKLVTEVQQATCLIVNANFVGDDERATKHGHMTTEQAADLATNAGVKKLYLQHLSPRYSQRRAEILATVRAVFPESYWAEDCQEISF